MPAAEPSTVDELAPRGLELRVTCRSCRHRARIPGTEAAALLARRHRGPAIAGVAAVLRCSMCDAKAPEVRALPIADARQRALERREVRD